MRIVAAIQKTRKRRRTGWVPRAPEKQKHTHHGGTLHPHTLLAHMQKNEKQEKHGPGCSPTTKSRGTACRVNSSDNESPAAFFMSTEWVIRADSSVRQSLSQLCIPPLVFHLAFGSPTLSSELDQGIVVYVGQRKKGADISRHLDTQTHARRAPSSTRLSQPTAAA